MIIINKNTKVIEQQPWRDENWMGVDWAELPARFYELALENTPYLSVETEVITETIETGEDNEGNMQYEVVKREVVSGLNVLPHETNLSPLKSEKQDRNNAVLAEYLKSHPITWQDGKQYGITQADQQEISLNILQYQIAEQAGIPAKLEWHAIHEECRAFTVEDLMGLANAISEAVIPLVRHNQSIKTQIYAATTLQQLEDIKIEYA